VGNAVSPELVWAGDEATIKHDGMEVDERGPVDGTEGNSSGLYILFSFLLGGHDTSGHFSSFDAASRVPRVSQFRDPGERV
jgi:hypothetical protein